MGRASFLLIPRMRVPFSGSGSGVKGEDKVSLKASDPLRSCCLDVMTNGPGNLTDKYIGK